MDKAQAHFQRAIEADPRNARVLSNYAFHLQFVRKDMDGAEAHYQRAFEADPKDAEVYAYFLQTVRKNMERAEAHFQRAIEADPRNASARIYYAALLGGRGDFVAMRQQLDEVELQAIETRHAARLHFLRYAHLVDERDDALHSLPRVLYSAKPSPHFDLTPNVERARADGHPHVSLLEDLARVLKGEASIEVLDSHAAWQAALGVQISNSTSEPPSRERRSKRGRRK